eukprot:CAMPEP_0184325738 /NCGR_PEP_ID=MMETSP1049-20130417/141933_1 /TAXON_ID=77928 /ORGANISM="Proteomonas sulcata, Strain CCMP704" /LENGTH=50 /DNA_ID=CAMNT_0026647879 /DNA_START=474 /DNA_END=626 /DNA_ORIENTATION=-
MKDLPRNDSSSCNGLPFLCRLRPLSQPQGIGFIQLHSMRQGPKHDQNTSS